jgi:hypothetical protein
LDGSELSDKILFEYEGELIIEESIVADWYGSDISVREVILPKEFSLERAYPNPFNPVTNITIALPVDSEVNLIVHDLQGRKVAELVNGIKLVGYHTIQWDASKFSSGIYFVNMVARPEHSEAGGVASEYQSNQKLMLVK